MRFDKKSPSKSDKKSLPKAHKKGVVGYNKKTALLEEAITHMNAGKYGRSSAVLKELLALDPLNTEARRLFATLHLRLGSLISARTAFESLAREALERQDFWLAESLLREYLSAGPRCVPFLDMLGQLYEAKGDSAAAVSEYGKAIDVLIEDPDTENPARAAELFQKIQSLAPGSPTAFRLAPLFDSNSGQLLAPPIPSNHGSTSETGQPVMEPLPEPVGDAGLSSSIALEPPGPIAERIEAPERSALLAEAAATETLSEGSADELRPEPIENQGAEPPEDHIEKPQPASAGPQSSESLSTSSGVETSNADAPFKLADETSGAITQPIGMETAQDQRTTFDATGFTLKQDVALPDAAQPLGAPDLSLREVTNPIAEPPPTPLPMPWDQVQDTTLSIPRPAEDETQASMTQDIESAPMTESTSLMDDQPSLPVSSENFLSSMSWEEILAAVGGSSSEVSAEPSANKPALDDASVSNEPANPNEMSREPVQAPAFVDEPPSRNVLDAVPAVIKEPIAESQNLPAPMPWEQVEEEAVPILQHEPEPEYGVVPENTLTPFVDDTLSPSTSDTLALPDAVPAQMPETTAALLPATQLSTPAEVTGPLPPAGGERSCPAPFSPEPLVIERSTVDCADIEPLEPAQNEESAPAVDESIGIVGEQSVALDARGKVIGEAAIPAATPVHIERVSGSEPTEDQVQDGPTPLPTGFIRIEQKPKGISAEYAVVGNEVGAVNNEAPIPPDETVIQAESQQDKNHPIPDIDSITERAAHSEPPSTNLEEMAATPDHSFSAEEPSVVADSATPGDIKILWDNPTPQPAPGQTGSNLLTRWLRRSKGMEQSDNQMSSENQASGDGLASNEPSISPPSAASNSSLESSPAGVKASAVSAIDVLFDHSDRSIPAWKDVPAQKQKGSKPLAGRIYNRLRFRAVLFIGTCFSTTRSMTITLISLASVILALGIVSLGVAGLAWILMEQRPNTAFYNLSGRPQRTLQETSTNGYLLLLGFDEGNNRDPIQTGFERKFEQSDLAMTDICLMGRGARIGNDHTADEKTLATWQKEPDPAARFRAQAAGVRALVGQSDQAMTRYKRWLKMSFEDWGYGERISPNCPLLLYAHRLYVADGFAQDVEPGIERLEVDLAMWRTVLGQARTLPVKMLAADAVTDDVAIVSGLLARPDLDERILGRLGKLVRPLDQVEQSLRWPMQSELTIAANNHDLMLMHDSSAGRPVHVSLISLMPLPKQRRLNLYADYYQASSKAASEGRFASFPKRVNFIRSPAESWLDYGANPIENIMGVPPLPEWETYGGRIVEVEARLRLAALQAWIRRSPQEKDILTRMAKAGQSLYDPFTGFPMLVNRRKGLIYSVGPDGKDHDGQPGLDIATQIPSMPGGASQEGNRGASALKTRS